jgi:hypothetical protein
MPNISLEDDLLLSHQPEPLCRTASKSKIYLEDWQEWRDSNPQPPVLETGALAIELHS